MAHAYGHTKFILDRPVKDNTGLEGTYTFTLEWVPDSPHPSGIDGPDAVSDTPTGPSIFSAIQEQLGLKLQPRREQIETFVIDKADKLPISN